MFSRADRADMQYFLGYFVFIGLINATIAGVLLCRLPASHAPSLSGLVLRAALYVLAGAGAGVAGAWFYWRRSVPLRCFAPISFGTFSLICAAGWVWVPAGVLLSAQDSKATAIIGLLCGAVLGAGLRKGLGSPEYEERQAAPAEEKEIFAAALASAPREWHGYVIAGCIYAAMFAQRDHEYLGAALLGAVSAFLFAWKWNRPAQTPESRVKRDAGWRLARAGALAIVLTVWALIVGVAHRNASGDAALAADSADSAKARRGTTGESAFGPGGFESVILWPFPPKKQIIPPMPAPRNFLGPEKSRPMVIRFDGAYWYFQPPDTGPGRTAHQAHGTPLAVNIQSTDEFPLMMEAHQRLIGPVRLSRCREIDVEIQNRDNVRGALSLGLMLGDSELPGKPTLYLGQKEIETTMPGFFSYKTGPVFETIRFAIPAAAPIRRFDEITVMVLPDFEHSMIGPKIAIEQFELQPRKCTRNREPQVSSAAADKTWDEQVESVQHFSARRGSYRRVRAGFLLRGPAPASAQQVNRSSQLEQRIGGGLDAVHPRDRVEDDVLLLGERVRQNLRQLHGAQLHLFARLRPVHGGVVCRVSFPGELDQNSEADRRLRHTLGDLVEVVVCRESRGLLVGKITVPRFGNDAVTAEPLVAGHARERKCRHPKVGVGREARREGLGRLHEGQGGGMRTEEFFHRLGRRDIGSAGHCGAQELDELVTVARREAVGRVADDIGVDMFGEVEANGQSARIGVSDAVGNVGNAGRVREPNGDGGGRAGYVRSAGEGFRPGRGRERAGQHQALGMRGPETGMEAEQLIEDP